MPRVFQKKIFLIKGHLFMFYVLHIRKRKEGGMNIETLYKKYAPLVMRRCRQILKDSSWAEDAMQDTFVKLIRYQKKLTSQYPSSLLYTMATNVCFNLLRQHKRHAEMMDPEILDSIASHEDVHSQVEARHLLHLIFEEEKESTRAIATLYFVDRMTYEEVSKTVGMSISGIRKRLHKLKEKLKNTKEKWR